MSDQSIVTQGNYMSYREGSRVAGFALPDDRQLFLAAPDLLEALRDVVSQIAAYDKLFGENSCAIDDSPAQYAIAKATGREEEHVCDVGDKWCEEGANPARHPDHDSHVGGCNCPLKKETA